MLQEYQSKTIDKQKKINDSHEEYLLSVREQISHKHATGPP